MIKPNRNYHLEGNLKLSLKTQNLPILASLLYIQILIIHYWSSGQIDVSKLDQIASTSGILAAISVVTSLITNLVPANLKNCLIFLRIKNALPGHRFIQLATNDSRIDSVELSNSINNFDELVDSPKNQNSHWYKYFFTPNKDDTAVRSAHKNYLLYRDSAVVSLTALIIFWVALLSDLAFVPGYSWTMSIIFILAYLCSLIAANINGKRFVCNAVSIELSKK